MKELSLPKNVNIIFPSSMAGGVGLGAAAGTVKAEFPFPENGPFVRILLQLWNMLV